MIISLQPGEAQVPSFLDFTTFVLAFPRLKRALALRYVIRVLASLVGAAVNHLFISFHQTGVRSSPAVWLLAGLEPRASAAAVALLTALMLQSAQMS